MNATSATNPGLPAEALERLAAFAAQSGAAAPSCITIDQGDGATFSDEILRYCQNTGLSLDWFYFGTGAQTVSREDRA